MLFRASNYFDNYSMTFKREGEKIVVFYMPMGVFRNAVVLSLEKHAFSCKAGGDKKVIFGISPEIKSICSTYSKEKCAIQTFPARALCIYTLDLLDPLRNNMFQCKRLPEP